MGAIRWLLVIIVSAILSFGHTFYIFAASPQQADLPLEITIITAQEKVVVGESITWRVMLTPKARRIGSIELRSGNARAWAWLKGSQTIQVLTNTVVLDVLAVPLVIGNLPPVLEVHYTIGKKVQRQLVVGDNVVQVEPLKNRIEAGVMATQGTARQGEHLPVELWIRNSSPFTLTEVQIRGSGIDLTWGAPIIREDIPTGKIFTRTLTPTVTGFHPQPQLSIVYAWTDLTGAPHDQSLYIAGETVAIKEGIFDRISDQTIGLLLGVAAGVLTTLLTTWVGGELVRIRQKKVNRQQVYGLLRLLISRSRHAANNGVTVDLEPLDTIFKQESLSTILEEDKLTESSHNLWEMAMRHNTGLSQPGGAQRSDELHESAQALSKKLIGRKTD